MTEDELLAVIRRADPSATVTEEQGRRIVHVQSTGIVGVGMLLDAHSIQYRMLSARELEWLGWDGEAETDA